MANYLRKQACERFVQKQLNSHNFTLDNEGVVYVNKEPVARVYCTIDLEDFVWVKFASASEREYNRDLALRARDGQVGSGMKHR